MSYARKCDRCGVCFDPYSGTGEFMRFQNPSYQTAKSLRQNSHTKLFFNDANIDTYVDLSPACTTAFDKFMKCEEADKVVEKHAVNHKGYDSYYKDLKQILDDLNKKAPEHGSFREAKQLLDKMNEMISEYGNVSVLDYADLAGLDMYFGYMYLNYGWTDLSDARIYCGCKSKPNIKYYVPLNFIPVTEPDYWVLELPEPVRLDN